eukprot:4365082-Pyramimonas_sp.AAC.1
MPELADNTVLGLQECAPRGSELGNVQHCGYGLGVVLLDRGGGGASGLGVCVCSLLPLPRWGLPHLVGTVGAHEIAKLDRSLRDGKLNPLGNDSLQLLPDRLDHLAHEHVEERNDVTMCFF